jgi:hypothetical protein
MTNVQLPLLTERTPFIKIMTVPEDFERSKHPCLDISKHPFVVTINWPNGNTVEKQEVYNEWKRTPRYSNFMCACRTLNHFSYFGGFITDELTGKVTSMVQAQEEVLRYPYGKP